MVAAFGALDVLVDPAEPLWPFPLPWRGEVVLVVVAVPVEEVMPCLAGGAAERWVVTGLFSPWEVEPCVAFFDG